MIAIKPCSLEIFGKPKIQVWELEERELKNCSRVDFEKG